MKEDREKFDFVDALRGIAIILVITAHNYLGFANEHPLYPSWFGALIYQGVYGVQLFYIMSAFTLLLSLSGSGKNRMSVKSFLIRRFFRIAPLFYLAILFFSVQVALQGSPVSAAQIISTLTFTNGFSIDWINGIFPGSWSIAIEMPFYLIIPFLFVYITDLNKAVVAFICSVLLSFGLNILLKHTSLNSYAGIDEFLYFYLPSQMPVFLLGIILFFLTQQKQLAVKPATWLITSLVVITHYVLGGKGIIQPFVLLSFGFLMFSWSLYRLEPVLFVNRFTIFFGKISFGLYLFHWAVFDLVSELDMAYLTSWPMLNFILREVMICALAAGLAWALHILVEKPFQDLGRRISNAV